MQRLKRYPEIYVEGKYLSDRTDIIKEVVQVDMTTFKVRIDHPVFGDTVEIMELDTEDGTLCLRSIFPSEMQSEEEMDIVKDYYNNFILNGQETYIEYFNKDIGYFLLSRNIGIYPVGNE